MSATFFQDPEETNIYIQTFVKKVKEHKNANYTKHMYVEPIYQKVEDQIDYSIHEFKPTKDFKSFHSDLKKQAKYEKTKPGNARVIEYEKDEDAPKVDLLKDAIFETNPDPETIKEGINVNEMSIKELMKGIHFFLKKKNILLSQDEMAHIEKTLETPLFERDKYIKFSKSTRMISKLEFIHKKSEDCYEVSFEEVEKAKEKEKKYVRKSFFK